MMERPEAILLGPEAPTAALLPEDADRAEHLHMTFHGRRLVSALEEG